MRRVMMVCGMAMFASGCVMKAKYDRDLSDLVARHGTETELFQNKLEEVQSEARRLERELEQATVALDDVTRQLASKVAEAGQLQADVEQMQVAIEQLAEKQARAAAALAAYRDLVDRFQSLIDAGTLQVKVIGGRMVVELATDILFAPGSATLSKDGKTALEEVATVLASIADREYQIAGHTDDKPIRTDRFPNNWYLGSGRAASVVAVLMEAGLSGDRVSAASFAEFRPAQTNRTAEGRAANRRIEIIVIPDLSSLPGYDELQAIAESGEALPKGSTPERDAGDAESEPVAPDASDPGPETPVE